MPGPGNSVLWNEQVPAETDIADAAPIRSIVTSIRNGLQSEHNWPTSTGPNFGYHLLGSCRPFWDVQSNVSSSGTDGRLMVTSDTSRFFHVGSAGTMLLGSQNVILAGSALVGGQTSYWAQEFGEVSITSTTQTVSFANSGFSGIPVTTCSVSTTLVTPIGVVIASRLKTSFDVKGYNFNSGSATSNYTLMFHSIGTRTF